MPRTRFTYFAAFAGLLLLPRCAEEPAESFAELEPAYFAALDVTDAATREKLPDFERRMNRMARRLIAQVDSGELADTTARREAGRALLYAGFMPHVGHHGLEDGFDAADELLHPPQYSDGTNDKAELAARMTASAELLSRAAALRADDMRITTVERSVKFNLAALQGPVASALLQELLSAAETDFFSMFAALVLWRDPALHPMSSPHMTALYQLLCSPARFDCARMGPPPVNPNPPPPTLTQLVVGPTMVSDLLVKRAEQLAAQAEAQAPAQPAAAKAALGEAQGLLTGARGTVAYASLQASLPPSRHFRFPEVLDERVARIDALKTAITARLADMPQPLPETRLYYQSHTYRTIYQCVACHSAAPEQAGVPQ